MYVFVLSQKHLRHIEAEFRNLSTKMVGYGNIKKAFNGLLQINYIDLCGFIYVDPSVNMERSLAGFIQRADQMSDKGTLFLIAVADTSGLQKVLQAITVKNLDIRVFQYSVLTDFNIRREIIAPVLLSKKQPYKAKKISRIDPILKESKPLRLPQIYSDNFLLATSELEVYDLESSLNSDSVLLSFKYSPCWRDFRKWVIHSQCGYTTSFDLNKYARDFSDEDYCAIKYYIKGGVI